MVKSKTATWFETKVRYEKDMEDGSRKKITEPYVIEAFTFTESEASILENVEPYISGEFDVTDIKKASYCDIIFSENPRDDKWYKVKLQYIQLDEKSGKEKLSSVFHLVQASSLQGGVKNVEDYMSDNMMDWKFASITETAILDVFEANGNAHVNKVEEDARPEYEDALAAETAIAEGEDIAQEVSE